MKILAVILSYKRPQNIQKIVDELFKVERVAEVIISNNNPDIHMEEWLSQSTLELPKIKVINNTERKHCIERFIIALGSDHKHFLCPDDDIFLTADQYNLLLDKYALKPEKVHGIRGQIKGFDAGIPVLKSGVCGVTAELDVLNCLYVFSYMSCAKLFVIAEKIGLQSEEHYRQVDDMLLSFSGKGRPVCHDVGNIELCDTQDSMSIATWREQGFEQRRNELYGELERVIKR